MSIKECPFCGSSESQIHNHVVTNHFRITGLDWFVQCSNCKTEGPGADSKEFAIRVWNEGTPRYHRVFKLEEALKRIRDCDFVITLPDRMDAVRKIAREALE